MGHFLALQHCNLAVQAVGTCFLRSNIQSWEQEISPRVVDRRWVKLRLDSRCAHFPDTAMQSSTAGLGANHSRCMSRFLQLVARQWSE